jgi:hypothetical protein
MARYSIIFFAAHKRVYLGIEACQQFAQAINGKVVSVVDDCTTL